MNASVLALAFRPLFLAGALYGALVILYWAAYLSALVPLPGYFAPTAWHAHEMLFGFGAVILAGFLLTASKNWANVRGVHGAELLGLCAIWLAGRIALFASAHLPSWAVAACDLAFLPCVAFSLARTLRHGARKMNFVFVLWIAVFFAANLLMHLEATGVTAGTARRGYLLGVDTFVVLMILMGGRIIPMFTQNAIPGLTLHKRRVLEVLALGGAGLYLVADFVFESSAVTATLALAAGLANLGRLACWNPLRTAGRPILWVLHLGYGLVALGLFFRGASLSFLPVIPSVPIHLLTAGAMGLLILGMISRVSLGHTGRPIVASSPIAAAYVLVFLGACLRVLVPLFAPALYLRGLVLAALLWSAGFVLFAVVYWPMLTHPRIDGREG